jgi:hypothetical protein
MNLTVSAPSIKLSISMLFRILHILSIYVTYSAITKSVTYVVMKLKHTSGTKARQFCTSRMISSFISCNLLALCLSNHRIPLHEINHVK